MPSSEPGLPTSRLLTLCSGLPVRTDSAFWPLPYIFASSEACFMLGRQRVQKFWLAHSRSPPLCPLSSCERHAGESPQRNAGYLSDFGGSVGLIKTNNCHKNLREEERAPLLGPGRCFRRLRQCLCGSCASAGGGDGGRCERHPPDSWTRGIVFSDWSMARCGNCARRITQKRDRTVLVLSARRCPG